VTTTAFISAAEPFLAVVHTAGAKPTGAPPKDPSSASTATWDRAEPDSSWTRLHWYRAPTHAFFDAHQGAPTNIPYSDIIRAQEAAWQKIWQGTDIQIEGDPEAQQLVHKLMFDLLQSARPGGDDSIPPETLSGDFYKGHIFWDAEVWMFAALVAQHPDLARDILDYRFKHLEQAKAQAAQQGCKGADFPWESAASGKETAPGGFSEGRHVTAGVGWAVWQYYLATGDKKWLTERGWPLLSGVADYFATRAKKNPASGKYDIAGVTGPDEFALKATNNTYTNAMARNCLNYAAEAAKVVGKSANPQWKVVADGLALPFDKAKGVYLKMEGDDGKPGVKQADGELVLYPAELPMDAKTAAATFDFHKGRVIKNGPAMTDSIHALIAARLGRAEEAEKYFRDSYRPFVRGPFLLFSEKRSLDRCVFTTGAGGVLQSVLYGFGGLDYSSPDGLVKGPVALPPTWKKLTISGIYRGGKRYTLTVAPQGRTLTPQND
jgi:trehalose/maltose hydrolase-like predicted phosphorylase